MSEHIWKDGNRMVKSLNWNKRELKESIPEH